MAFKANAANATKDTFTATGGDGSITYDSSAKGLDTTDVTVTQLGKDKSGWDGKYNNDVKTLDLSKASGAVKGSVDGNVESITTGKKDDDITIANTKAKTVSTGNGKDKITVSESKGSSNLEIDSGAGDDVVQIDGTAKSVNLVGGANKLTVNGSGKVTEVTAGTGNDTLDIKGTVDSINLTKGNNKVTIENNLKTLTGGTGNDTLITEKKDDNGGYSAITIDKADMNNGKNNVTVGQKVTVKELNFGKGNSTLKVDTEGAVNKVTFGESGNDSLVAFSSANIKYADLNAGNDIVSLAEGANATLNMGAGNDVVTIGAGVTASVNVGDGNDKIYINSVNSDVKIDGYSEGKNQIFIGKDIANNFNAQNVSIDNKGNVTISFSTTGSVIAGDIHADGSITLNNVSGSVINIMDGSDAKGKTYLYQQVVLGTEADATVDSKSYGNAPIVLQADKLKTVSTDKKRGAMNLTVRSNEIEQVTASGKADVINVFNLNTSADTKAVINYNQTFGTGDNQTFGTGNETTYYGTAWSAKQVTINSGAGNDTIVVKNGDNFYLADFTIGSNPKKADALKLEGVGAANVIAYDNETKDVTLGFVGLGTDASAGYTTSDYVAKVTIAKGLWDGVTAGKNLIDATGKEISNLKAPDVSVETPPSNGIVDLKYTEGVNSVSYFNAKGPLTVNNKFFGTDAGSFEVVGSKGKDTLFGADDWSNKVVEFGTAIEANKITIGWSTDITSAQGTSEDKQTFYQFATVATEFSTSYYHEDGANWNIDIQAGTASTENWYAKVGTGGNFLGFAKLENGKYNDKDKITIKSEGVDIVFGTDGKNELVTGAYQLGSNHVFGTEDPVAILNGGAGNDLLIAGVSGGTLKGADGNDTLRTGANYASVRSAMAPHIGTDDNFADVVLDGGAGNDTFVITGESNAVVNYRNSNGTYDKTTAEGKASIKAYKTAYGDDALVFSYDKANAKDPQAQVQIVGAALTAASVATGDLKVEKTDSDYAFMSDTYVLNLAMDNANVWIGDTVNSDNASGFKTNAQLGTVVVTGLKEGMTINAQVGGVKYNQAFNSKDKKIESTGNFNGFFAPQATSISGNGVLVGNQNTTVLTGGEKNDTLVANNTAKATLNGGGGTNVFDVTGAKGDVEIQGYDPAKKSSIKIANIDTIAITGSKDNIKVNNKIEIKGVAGKDKGDVIFSYDEDVNTATTKNGKTTWKVTKKSNTMARAFEGDATVVAVGAASTYIKTFSGLDDKVKFVNASKANKLAEIDIQSTAVTSLLGGGGSELIKFGTTEEVASVTTGKGNDTIDVTNVYGEGIYITDFTKATKDKNTSKFKAGDVIKGDLSKDGVLSFDGNDVIIKLSDDLAPVVLKGMKDQEIGYVTEDGAEIALKTLNDPEEYQYGADNRTTELAKGANVDGYVNNPEFLAVDASKNNKGAVVNAAKFAQKVYAGKAVDTIFAGFGGNYPTVGLSTEAFNGQLGTGEVSITGGAGADFFVFNNMIRTSSFTTFSASVSTSITNLDNIETYFIGTGAEDTINIFRDNGITYKVSTNASGYELYKGYETPQLTTYAVEYTIKDYAGDKIVFGTKEGTVGISTSYFNKDVEYAFTEDKKGNKTYYSDVTLVLTDGNKVKFEKVAVVTEGLDSKVQKVPVFKLTRASEEGSKTFFSLDYLNEMASIGAADGTDFFNVSGAAADTIMAGNTKNITIGGVGYDRYGTVAADFAGTNPGDIKTEAVINSKFVTVQASEQNKGAITFIGNYGIGSTADADLVAHNSFNVSDTFQLNTAENASYFGTATFDLQGIAFADSINGGSIFTKEAPSFGTADKVQVVFGTGADDNSLYIKEISVLGTTNFGTSNTDQKYYYNLGQTGTSFTVQFNSAGIEHYGLNTAALGGSTFEFGINLMGTNGKFTNETFGTSFTGVNTEVNIAVSYQYSLAGHSEQNRAAYFIGGKKNDVYVGKGSKDTVDFSAGGNNTIYGGRADVTLGNNQTSNADMIILGHGDDVTISNYFNDKKAGGLDKVYLDTIFGGEAQLSTMYFVDSFKGSAGDGALVMEFTGAENDNVPAHARVTFKNYKASENPTIYIGQRVENKGKAKLVAFSQASYLGTKSGEVISIGGSAGNDTIDVGVYGVKSATGGKGKNVFKINSNLGTGIENAATIETFLAADTIIYDGNKITFDNYSDDYVFDGGKNATVRVAEDKYVVLTGVGKKDNENKATNKIKSSISNKDKVEFKGVALSNQKNVVLAAAKADSVYQLDEWGWDENGKGITDSFDAKKAGKKFKTEVYANASLSSYTASAGVDKLYLSTSDSSKKVTYTFTAQGALEDTIIFGNSKNTLAFDNSAVKGSSLEYTNDISNSNEITIDVLNAKAKSQGKANLIDNTEDGGLFTYTYGANITDTTKGEKNAADSDTLYGKVSYWVVANGGGLSNVTLTSYKDEEARVISEVITVNGEKVTVDNTKDIYAEIGEAIGLGTAATVNKDGKGILGSSYGADKYYEVAKESYIGTFGFDMGTNGKYAFGSAFTAEATVKGSNVSFDGSNGYNIESMTLSVFGTNQIITDGGVLDADQEEGKISIRFSSADNAFKFGTDADEDGRTLQFFADKDGLKYNVKESTTSESEFNITTKLNTATEKITNVADSVIGAIGYSTVGSIEDISSSVNTSTFGTVAYSDSNNDIIKFSSNGEQIGVTISGGHKFTIQLSSAADYAFTGLKDSSGNDLNDYKNDPGFQFQVEGIDTINGYETFTLNTSNFSITWTKDVLTREITLGTGDKYTVSYGTDVFGNSTYTMSTIALNGNGTGIDKLSIDTKTKKATIQINSSANVGATTEFTFVDGESKDDRASISWNKKVSAQTFSLKTSSLAENETTFFIGFATDAYGNSLIGSSYVFKGDSLTDQMLNGSATNAIGTGNGFYIAGLFGTSTVEYMELGTGKITDNEVTFAQANTYTGFGTLVNGYNTKSDGDVTDGVITVDYGENNEFTSGDVVIYKFSKNTNNVTTDTVDGSIKDDSLTAGDQEYTLNVNNNNVTVTWKWENNNTYSLRQLGTATSVTDWEATHPKEEAAFDERFYKEYDIITAPETLFSGDELDDIVEIKSNVDTASTDKENAFENKNVLAISTDDLSSNKKQN